MLDTTQKEIMSALQSGYSAEELAQAFADMLNEATHDLAMHAAQQEFDQAVRDATTAMNEALRSYNKLYGSGKVVMRDFNGKDIVRCVESHFNHVSHEEPEVDDLAAQPKKLDVRLQFDDENAAAAAEAKAWSQVLNRLHEMFG